jgi:hypothetical protein
VAEENLPVGVHEERGMPLPMERTKADELATAAAKSSEPGGEIQQINARLHSRRVGVKKRKRIKFESHDA